MDGIIPVGITADQPAKVDWSRGWMGSDSPSQGPGSVFSRCEQSSPRGMKKVPDVPCTSSKVNSQLDIDPSPLLEATLGLVPAQILPVVCSGCHKLSVTIPRAPV